MSKLCSRMMVHQGSYRRDVNMVHDWGAAALRCTYHCWEELRMGERRGMWYAALTTSLIYISPRHILMSELHVQG